MAKTKKSRLQKTCLRIEGEMSIYRAAELKQTLMTALTDSEVLEIDLSSVTDLDTAGVQLLILAKQAAQGKKQELHFTAHSPVVLDVLELLGLTAVFGDTVIIDSQPSFASERKAPSASQRYANEH